MPAPRPPLPPDRLAAFTKAMQQVYRFPIPEDNIPAEALGHASSSSPWTPPPASAGHKGRYLWTDAFGLVNFLTLHRLTGASDYFNYATTLAHTVHDVLGRTRDGSARLPGASDTDPLGGGLRIGKEDASGPDGDGQYHHYLSLWMFALNRLAVASRRERRHGDALKWNGYAVRLMQAVHPAFVYDRQKPRPRMYWKVSTGLERPLVTSEGNLDPVDGLVVCKVLRDFARQDDQESDVLREEMRDYERIVSVKWEGYGSRDPLDLGMTLWTAHLYGGRETWARGLLERAERDLKKLLAAGYFGQTIRTRLAFREFGTVLGIRCAFVREPDWQSTADKILETWERAGVEPGMEDLRPITLVMYAAAIEPGAFRRGWLEES